MEEKEISVLIVENEELAKRLVKDHFGKTGITYAGIFDASCRNEIAEALNKIQD